MYVMHYANSSAYYKYAHKLYVLQKKALRVMYNTIYNAQSIPLFETTYNLVY